MNTIHSPQQTEAQIQQFETQNTKKVSLIYQNQPQFIELNHTNLQMQHQITKISLF